MRTRLDLRLGTKDRERQIAEQFAARDAERKLIGARQC
jgi:hypothetical protein